MEQVRRKLAAGALSKSACPKAKQGGNRGDETGEYRLVFWVV